MPKARARSRVDGVVAGAVSKADSTFSELTEFCPPDYNDFCSSQTQHPLLLARRSIRYSKRSTSRRVFTPPRVLQSSRRPSHTQTTLNPTSKMSQPKVGFLGLGIMGAQMAARLVRSGANVTVYNRSVAKTEPLRALGASVAATPAEVTQECDLVFAMLADPKAAMKVATDGPDAACAGIAARPTTAGPITYVDCSTVDAETGALVGDAVQTAMLNAGQNTSGGGFLAAPVSGGWRDCRDGTLLFLCGGSQAAYDAACVPHGLDAMGHKRWLLGPTPGDAARAKLMLQVMMGNIVGSLAEMMSLTKASGLDEEAILDVLSNSAMGNPLTTAKGKLMKDKNFAPNFQVYLQQKDLRLALQLADDLGVPAPISAAANGQYIRARQMGLANADFAAVRQAYEAEAVADKESETEELN